MSDPNTSLMQRIQTQYGGVIQQVAATSSVPPAFLAALIANETGGNPNAKRFEPTVFAQLCELMVGQRASMQVTGIPTPVGPADAVPNAASQSFVVGLARLRDLASSWGITQILAWQVLALGLPATVLSTPLGALQATVKLLAAGASAFGLDLTMPTDDVAEDFFRFWNAGSPNGKTYDPAYAQNGMARMKIYAALLAAPIQ